MSTVTPIIDHVEDLWPAEGVPEDTLGQLVLASHLLGANRAVSNFGGGNTSAKGVDDRSRRARGQRAMWVKGSGSDLATMGPEHFTGARARRGAAADGARRDVRRGHGRLPRALPARPRRAARVDRDAAARVRPRAARAPHAPGRDQRARRHAPTASG